MNTRDTQLLRLSLKYSSVYDSAKSEAEAMYSKAGLNYRSIRLREIEAICLAKINTKEGI